MKTIEIKYRSDFNYYDNLVESGSLLKKDTDGKPSIGTDSKGRSYKIYQQNISTGSKIGKQFAFILSCIIFMPLWSKDCRRLWSEAANGKEDVKVVILNPKLKDGEMSKVANIINRCVTNLKGQHPTSLSIFLQLKLKSETITKQFVFTNENTSIIKEKIENYLKEKILDGKSLMDTTYSCDIMGIAKTDTDLEYYECDDSISASQSNEKRSLGMNIASKTESSRTESSGNSIVSSDLIAVSKVTNWLQSHIPNAVIVNNNEFVKIDGIYEPL